MQGLKVTKFIPVNREQIFAYWIRPELLEAWSYPDGMSLRVPVFEAFTGGHYRFEHSNSKGVYVCTGHIDEMIPHDKLVVVDEEVTGPDGKTMYQNLVCITEFHEKNDGTEILVSQHGFVDRESMEECRQGWRESLEKLAQVLAFGPEYKAHREDFRGHSI